MIHSLSACCYVSFLLHRNVNPISVRKVLVMYFPRITYLGLVSGSYFSVGPKLDVHIFTEVRIEHVSLLLTLHHMDHLTGILFITVHNILGAVRFEMYSYDVLFSTCGILWNRPFFVAFF